MIQLMAANPHIDAIAAMQVRRSGETPLCNVAGSNTISLEKHLIPVTTAHFGFTMIRVPALEKMEKPWFWSKPNEKNSWEDGRIDDDIWFWHQFNNAGNKLYMARDVRVGHAELFSQHYDDNFAVEKCTVRDWYKKQPAKLVGGDWRDESQKPEKKPVTVPATKEMPERAEVVT
jgi:hypothetical protein